MKYLVSGKEMLNWEKQAMEKYKIPSLLLMERAAQKVVEELMSGSYELKNILIVKVDVDEASILASRYGVMSIPTLLFFKDGTLVHEQIGLLPPNQLLDLFKTHL